MVGNILESLPDLLKGVSTIVIDSLKTISSNSDELVQTGIEIITGLATAIVEAAPYLVEAAWNLAASLGKALIETDWATIGSNLMSTLKSSIDSAAGNIFGGDSSMLKGFLDGITNALPDVLSKGVELISSLANGILDATPQLITLAGDLVVQFSNFLQENGPTLLQAGADLLINIVTGIIDHLPEIASSAISVIGKLTETFLTNAPQLIQSGLELIGKLIVGLIQAIPKIVAAIPQIITAIKNTFTSFDWPSIGKNLLIGIKNGILGAVSSVVEAAREAASAVWNTVKSFFDIGSPSKLMAYAGEMIDEGLAGGIEKNSGLVDDAMGALNESTVSQLQTEMNINPVSASQTPDGRLENLMTMLDTYLPQIAEGMNVGISLEGDAQGLFNVVRGQNKIYKKMNGQSAFA
jgi:phage-related protein